MTSAPAAPVTDVIRHHRPTLTKIVATIGPACDTADGVAKLIEAGVGVFRFNFSHGDLEDHAARLEVVRTTAREAGVSIAVLGDLQGPKIRVTKSPEGGVEAPTGAAVVFERDRDRAEVKDGVVYLGVTYEELIDEVEVGHRVLIDDGAVRMLAVDTAGGRLTCTVTFGGSILSSKGVNLPDTRLSAPAMTERDWTCAEWAVKHELDFVALSFVAEAADVVQLREGMKQFESSARASGRLGIVSKIERPSAVENAAAIVEASDAIMIARGDLGVEMDYARVPVIQRQLLRTAQRYGKPCIVATQMLQSMMEAPAPTRAEATDVANAIFQGADAVMLSGETAAGRFPVVAVETMRRIAEQAEAFEADEPRLSSPPEIPREMQYATAALAHGAWVAARDAGARFIVVWSQQGGSARFLSQNNFRMPIIAVSSSERALRRMQLLRAVTPIHMATPDSVSDFNRRIDAELLRRDWARRGDVYVVLAGGPIGQTGVTNSFAIATAGSPEGGFLRHGEKWSGTPTA